MKRRLIIERDIFKNHKRKALDEKYDDKLYDFVEVLVGEFNAIHKTEFCLYSVLDEE